jgi:hypothetical protein
MPQKSGDPGFLTDVYQASGTKRHAGRAAYALVPRNVPVYGYIHDLNTGRLNEVTTATEAGKAAA